ncbi:MAG: 4-hydroxy-tetrahydrodipicolinate synthase [Firmicutes bacterium HGW-Firmicutes-14]|nr:MAG: 4-hydroxy-tetrahydrodipicolinate synthase [Firmicutes bacterium HGW-Firmicutes-14]
MTDFGRVLTAMVTPFTSDMEVNYGKARQLASYLVEIGCDGIVVAGTTGESPTLTRDEKLRLFETIVNEVGGKAKVIAGTGSNVTADTVSLTKDAEKTGVDGIMLVTPYYNKPPQDGLYNHFKIAAAATNLPVMLYNVPGRTSINLLPDTVAKLARIENIVAVKEASGNLDQVAEIRRSTPSDFLIYSGDDSLTLPMLTVGGHGVVSVVGHVVAGEMKKMIEAFFAGDTATATEIHLDLCPVFKAMFITANPIPVKTAMNIMGHEVGDVRPPLSPAGEAEVKVIKEVLRYCNKI